MFFCHTINPSLTKLVRWRWLGIGQVLFLRFYGQRRSRLVNNIYFLGKKVTLRYTLWRLYKEQRTAILGLCWWVGCVCVEGKNPAGSIPLAPPTTPFQRCFGSFVFPHVESIIPVIRQTLRWQQANPYHTAYRSPLNRSSWCIEIAIGWPTCPLRGANQRSVVSVNACAVSVLDTRPVADLWALTKKEENIDILHNM